jgi:hypothetical protein
MQPVMSELTFRCPSTSIHVSVSFETDSKSDPNVYDYVKCPACTQMHLVSRSTGQLLGLGDRKQ